MTQSSVRSAHFGPVIKSMRTELSELNWSQDYEIFSKTQSETETVLSTPLYAKQKLW